VILPFTRGIVDIFSVQRNVELVQVDGCAFATCTCSVSESLAEESARVYESSDMRLGRIEVARPIGSSVVKMGGLGK
jgi:hypothetical protein